MKKPILSGIGILFFFFTGFAQDLTWPRTMTQNGNVLVLYTPQVEDWPAYETMDFRMAFSLTPYQGKEVEGVVYIHATTFNNTYDHLVSIYNMSITAVHFPSLDPTASQAMGQIVRGFLDPTKTVTMPLEQVVACTPKPQSTKTVEVNNEPPLIFVSNTPAIVLQSEGEPSMADATKGGIQYVFNANWPLFFDKKSSKYYLFDNMEWQVAGQLPGPWSFTSSLPSSLSSLATNSQWKTTLKGAIPAPSQANASMPTIFYATKPAEIILFQGAPNFVSIPGTSLTYAVNTSNNVFYSNLTTLYYYLAAGRWFSAESLAGPWTYATPNLPADFSNIPTSSPAARVLSAVPGTYEAADAVMIAQIPTKTVVNTATAPPVTITYSGSPTLVAIQGTSLSYIANTSYKVIVVNDNSYYACVNGLWYTAGNANGPWTVATSVPEVIYTIPPSSPVYNVTYVTQTTISTGQVQSSYTAGYFGAFVVGFTAGAIIASGSGFYYPPYMYYPPMGFPICYAGACTYGAYAYHPYGYYGGVGYGASYNPYTGTYARSATAYGPYGSATRAQAYNPYTGTMARGASVSTPYGTRSAAQAYNPYTGASATTRQRSSAYGQAGTSTYQNGRGQGVQTAHASSSITGQSVGAARTSNGDMYASKDGNVYKNTGDGWNKMGGNGSWSSPEITNTDGARSGGSYHNANAPNSEMSGAAQDRQRGNAGASSWGSGGGFGGSDRSGSFSGGGWGGGGGGWGGASHGGGWGGGGGGFGGGGFGGRGGGFGGRR